MMLVVTLPLTAHKTRPTFGKEYSYPETFISLGEVANPSIKVWSTDIAFEKATFTFEKSAYTVIVPSVSGNLSVPEKLSTTSQKGEERQEAKITVPVNVRANGEYLIDWKADLLVDDKVVKTVSGTLSVLAQNSHIWIGGDSIDLAYVECLKMQLGIKGTPSGNALKQLNEKWAEWIEKRQIITNQKNN